MDAWDSLDRRKYVFGICNKCCDRNGDRNLGDIRDGLYLQKSDVTGTCAVRSGLRLRWARYDLLGLARNVASI
jgi:hypothetical protein